MNIIQALAYILAAGSTLLGFELHEHVHSARWKVKTLADSVAVPATVTRSTIEEQCALPAPRIAETVPRLSSEREVFVISANLIAAKKEFDGDYHLVLEDPVTHLHMIAEIPEAMGKAPKVYLDKFAAARKTIDRIAGAPGMLGKTFPRPVPIEITGLGFFDDEHMFTPKGMPANCREIHPVLQVRLLEHQIL